MLNLFGSDEVLPLYLETINVFAPKIPFEKEILLP